MIFADKLINERKKCGWSQEELAEKLNVSRQSVSKWESAQATPDIQKILKLAELFGVSTDYLLKDELEPESYVPESFVVEETEGSVRTVSMQEAGEIIAFEEEHAGRVANAVSMCIISPALLTLLCGLADTGRINMSEGLAAGIGMTVLFALVATAVYFFISYGTKAEPFEYLEKEVFETAYGVDGMVKEKKKALEQKRGARLAIGVILCVISAVPLVVAACLEAPDSLVVVMVALLLLIVAVGVNLMVKVSIVWSSYEKLLQENDYSKREKSKSRYLDTVSGIYWCAATAAYLAWSFISGNWDRTWILWPVAAVAYAVVEAITKSLTKEK